MRITHTKYTFPASEQYEAYNGDNKKQIGMKNLKIQENQRVIMIVGSKYRISRYIMAIVNTKEILQV